MMHGYIGRTVRSKKITLNSFLDRILPKTDFVVPLANGEPRLLMTELNNKGNLERLEDCYVHQMHSLVDSPYFQDSDFKGHLGHISYFLSSVTRKAYNAGNSNIDFVPSHFSEVPFHIYSRSRDRQGNLVAIAQSSSPDVHGYFSLGTNADYTSGFIGKIPFFLEVNSNMPRTHGQNQIHINQVEGYIENDSSLINVPRVEPSQKDITIANYISKNIGDGSTIQAGIGAIPAQVLTLLGDRKNLGIHTELFSEEMVELSRKGVIDGIKKETYNGKMVTTFALGGKELYDFLDDNASVAFLGVDYVNHPRTISMLSNFVSINACLEVDLTGQVASESLGPLLYSGSGGQSDFARGCMYSPGGKAFLVMHSTTNKGESKIKPHLTFGAAVTTMRNTVDHLVTEYGIAKLRGKTLSERAKALIEVAHPTHQEDLVREAKKLKLF